MCGLALGIRTYAMRSQARSENTHKKTSTRTCSVYHNPVLCLASYTKLVSLDMSVYVITGVSKGIGVSLPYVVLRIACA